MAKVTQGVKELQESQMIPEYENEEMKITRVWKSENKGAEMMRCQFVDPPDQALKGRSITYYLGNEDQGNWDGLLNLLYSMKLTECPDHDTGALVGLTFPGRTYRGTGRSGQPEAKVAPVVDWEWVSEVFGKGEDGASSTRRKKKAAKRRGR